MSTKLPEHLFVASDGALYDTRVPHWSRFAPLRAGYATPHRAIDAVAQLKGTLRYGPYAWPGGYVLYFICEDGAALCFDCVRKEFRQIVDAVAERQKPGNHPRNSWRVVACDHTGNCDTESVFCDHCSKPIWEPES